MSSKKSVDDYVSKVSELLSESKYFTKQLSKQKQLLKANIKENQESKKPQELGS